MSFTPAIWNALATYLHIDINPPLRTIFHFEEPYNDIVLWITLLSPINHDPEPDTERGSGMFTLCQNEKPFANCYFHVLAEQTPTKLIYNIKIDAIRNNISIGQFLIADIVDNPDTIEYIIQTIYDLSQSDDRVS